MTIKKYNLIGFDRFSGAKIEKEVLCNTPAKIKNITRMNDIIKKNGFICLNMLENSINFDFKVINIIKI